MVKLRNDEVIMTCKCGIKIKVRLNSDGWYVLEDINEYHTKRNNCGYWECGFKK